MIDECWTEKELHFVSARLAMTEVIDAKEACMIKGGGKRGEVRHFVAILSIKTNIHLPAYSYFSLNS